MLWHKPNGFWTVIRPCTCLHRPPRRLQRACGHVWEEGLFWRRDTISQAFKQTVNFTVMICSRLSLWRSASFTTNNADSLPTCGALLMQLISTPTISLQPVPSQAYGLQAEPLQMPLFVIEMTGWSRKAQHKFRLFIASKPWGLPPLWSLNSPLSALKFFPLNIGVQ